MLKEDNAYRVTVDNKLNHPGRFPLSVFYHVIYDTMISKDRSWSIITG